MKVSSVTDYSWLYSLLNNNTNRVQTEAGKAASSTQQINGVTNIDGDSFELSGAGTTGGSLLVGTNDDSNALDLKSFLEKVENGTVTQDDLDAMKEKLSRFHAVAGTMPPPPPLQGQDSAEDSITAFLDKVKAGTVTDADLKDMQTILSQLSPTYATATNSKAASGQQLASQLIEAYSKTGKIS